MVGRTGKTQIPIGILFSTSGPYAELGAEGRDGALAAISEINASDAFSFELVPESRDPKGNIEAYATACSEIIARTGTKFVVGCTTSWSRKEVIPVLEKKGAFLWYPCPYEGFEGNDHVVYVGACPNQHIVPMLGFIVPRFGHDPFLVGSNYIWGWETNRIAREQIEKTGGRVKGERFVPLGDTEIDHIISEIVTKRPDFILNTLIGPSSYAFVEAYRQLGETDPAFLPENRPIISCNFTEAEAARLGEAMRGNFNIAPYFQTLDTPDNAHFLDVASRYAAARNRISAFFAQPYTAVHMIARGIAMAGPDDAEAVLTHAQTSTFRSPFGPVRIDRNTNHTLLTPHIGKADAHGLFEIVSHAEQPVSPDPYLAHDEPARMVDMPNKTSHDVQHLRVIK